MLRKYLSAFVSLLLVVVSVIGVSLVTVYATSATGETEPNPTILNPSKMIYPTWTEGPFSTVYHEPITGYTKEDVQVYLDFFKTAFPEDAIYRNQENYDNAVKYAEEIMAKDDATQEEIDKARYDIVNAFRNLQHIGFVENPFLIGDYDCDANVTIKDATEVQMLISKSNLKDYNYTRADSDGDFNINIKDATMLQCYCAGYTDESACGKVGQYDTKLYFNNQYKFK